MSGTFDFEEACEALTGYRPFPWQARLFKRLSAGDLPSAVDIPTGLGKTSVMALWLLARAAGARLPRRLVHVVGRRAVVDQATTFTEDIRTALNRPTCPVIEQVQRGLALGDRPLAISTLRSKYVDNREWLEDPAAPAIIVGTVDMKRGFPRLCAAASLKPRRYGLPSMPSEAVFRGFVPRPH